MFGLNQNRAPQMTREQALAGVPVLNEGVSMVVNNGRTLVVLRTAALRRSRWSLLARLTPNVSERRFALDELGVEVLNQIDGRRTVRALVDGFADRHKVNRREAELSVAAFIRMLAQRGIVSVVVT
jgi:hypothetical protein